MIFENSKVKQHISLFIFLFVNFMFSVKYISRVTNYYFSISVIIVIVYFLIWKYQNLLDEISGKLKKINIFILVFLFIGSFFVFVKVPVETLNVDRWSVITTFWDNYFNDKYVYFARSCDNNPPGPMPFYFILALPFYFIGELGLFSVMGIALFYYLLKKNDISLKNQTLALLSVAGSLFYLWEIVSRSNIFLNGVLVLLVTLYTLKQKIIKKKQLLIIGVSTGLVLSTRNVFVIPFVILFVYSLNKKIINFSQLISIGCISLLTFTITFVPFVWNHLEDFKVMNPFIIQSSGLMPFNYTLIFIAMSFTVGFICKSKNDVFFYSGFILFLSICLYFTYWTLKIGFDNVFFESAADISYFILCIPFCIFHLLDHDNKKLLN
jgi:hypothetical protein